MNKETAVRLAQLASRAQDPNPYFWADFVLLGDGGEIDASLLSPPAQSSNTETIHPQPKQQMLSSP